MSKVRVAFTSFALGVLTSFFVFSGSQISILAQAPPSQPPAPQAPTPMPNIVGGRGVPLVPPIAQHFTDFGLAVPGMPFGVDGTECVRCVFTGQSFRYGGGSFQFTDFKFPGPVCVELIGAAAKYGYFSPVCPSSGGGPKTAKTYYAECTDNQNRDDKRSSYRQFRNSKIRFHWQQSFSPLPAAWCALLQGGRLIE
jgi:hypothetical protein